MFVFELFFQTLAQFPFFQVISISLVSALNFTIGLYPAMGSFGVRVGLRLIRLGWFLPRFGNFAFFTRLVCGLGLILALFPPSDMFVEW